MSPSTISQWKASFYQPKNLATDEIYHTQCPIKVIITLLMHAWGMVSFMSSCTSSPTRKGILSYTRKNCTIYTSPIKFVHQTESFIEVIITLPMHAWGMVYFMSSNSSHHLNSISCSYGIWLSLHGQDLICSVWPTPLGGTFYIPHGNSHHLPSTFLYIHDVMWSAQTQQGSCQKKNQT